MSADSQANTEGRGLLGILALQNQILRYQFIHFCYLVVIIHVKRYFLFSVPVQTYKCIYLIVHAFI